MMAEALIWVVMALAVGGLGYFVKVGKRYDLIAGYHPSQYPNPELLSALVGGTLLKAAFPLFGLAILRAFLPEYEWFLRIALFVTFAWLAVALVIGARRLAQK